MASEKATGLDRTTLGGRGTATESAGDAAVPALTILYHPRLERVGDRAILGDLAADNPVLLSRGEPVFTPPGQAEGAPLGDEHLSRRPLRLVSVVDGGVRIELGDSATAVVARGQRVCGAMAFTAAEIRRGVVLELGQRVVLLLHSVASLQDALGAADTIGEAGEIVGESDRLRRVLWEIRSVTDLDLPVLLRGETGSGKELVARAIHRLSSRREKPFIAVNAGAIPSTLAVAELFGSERGSFTGSVRRQAGYFEQASGGTLFLDEIGEAPVELQATLLRVLEGGEMQTVGASSMRKANVRIIAATDADLEGKVAAGTFRAPLLNRLSAYEIWLPPLRERRDDIGRLLVGFIREELVAIKESHRLKPSDAAGKPWLPASLVARLSDYEWPGNVRQLRNVVRQLVIGNRGRDRIQITAAVERLLGEHTPQGPASAHEPLQAAPVPVNGAPVALAADIAVPAPEEPSEVSPKARRSAPRRPADVTEAELGEALRASRWDFARAAELLGVSRASIYLLIERYPRFRTAGNLKPEEIIQCHRECGGDLARMAERLEVSERALTRRVKEIGLK